MFIAVGNVHIGCRPPCEFERFSGARIDLTGTVRGWGGTTCGRMGHTGGLTTLAADVEFVRNSANVPAPRPSGSRTASSAAASVAPRIWPAYAGPCDRPQGHSTRRPRGKGWKKHSDSCKAVNAARLRSSPCRTQAVRGQSSEWAMVLGPPGTLRRGSGGRACRPRNPTSRSRTACVHSFG